MGIYFGLKLAFSDWPLLPKTQSPTIDKIEKRLQKELETFKGEKHSDTSKWDELVSLLEDAALGMKSSEAFSTIQNEALQHRAECDQACRAEAFNKASKMIVEYDEGADALPHHLVESLVTAWNLATPDVRGKLQAPLVDQGPALCEMMFDYYLSQLQLPLASSSGEQLAGLPVTATKIVEMAKVSPWARVFFFPCVVWGVFVCVQSLWCSDSARVTSLLGLLICAFVNTWLGTGSCLIGLGVPSQLKKSCSLSSSSSDTLVRTAGLQGYVP